MAKTDTKTPQQEAREAALEQLAVLGGKLITEDDIVRRGNKYILPANSNWDADIDVLVARRDEEETDTTFNRTFNYRPMDGARATANAIKEFTGMPPAGTWHWFFGRELPDMIDVRTGPHPGDVEQVPWGRMTIPGLHGLVLNLGEGRHKEFGRVFQIHASGPRKYRYHAKGLFDLIEKHLREDSIFRGKAIDGGENFIDVNIIDPRDVVFTASVQRRLEGDVWAFIRHEKLLAQLGQDGKFTVLFEGDYGTGKTLAALITAQIAVEHGWTFLMCRPGKDNLVEAMEMVRMYQPAVLFAEDVDTTAGAGSGNTIERHLDLLDGIQVKGLRLLTVFTTNHPEDIHKGILRAKRIGAVISIGAMDRPGVEQLGRRVIGAALEPDVDWDAVFTSVEGYMPSFVREVFDRSVRYAITLPPNEGELGTIGTEAICLAADSLRDQQRLMEGAKEEVRQTDLATAFERVVTDAVNGTQVVDGDGDYIYELAAANGD